MRANEFIIEAEGTFYHGTRSDFDFSQLGSGKGLQTFDRILGPHFSATPDIASKFALGDPQTKGARTNKLDGARVFPANIPGEIYRVPQPPTVNDATAIIIDAVKKIVLPNKELVSELLNAAATGLLPMLKLSNDKVELPQAYATATKLIAEPVEWKKGITWGEMTAADYLDRYAPVGLVTKVAGMYKEMLIGQGYGLIEYRNTNKRETKGMKSNVSYIALMKPKSVFEDEKLDEAAYEGNIGMMEMFKFKQEATPEQWAELQSLIGKKLFKAAWSLIQSVTGTKLVGKEFNQ